MDNRYEAHVYAANLDEALDDIKKLCDTYFGDTKYDVVYTRAERATIFGSESTLKCVEFVAVMSEYQEI